MVIDINKVKPGMIVERPLYNMNGVIILNSGKILTESIITNLKNKGIKKIDVQLTKEQELLFQMNNDLYTTINSKLRNDSVDALKELNITKILDSSKKLVEAILKSTEFNYSLLDYKRQTDIYNHSVRVAAFACVLAKYYNTELYKKTNDLEIIKNQKINIENLTTAALAHDMGKTFEDKPFNINFNSIPNSFKKNLPGILNMKSNKFEKEYNSVYSFCLLSNFPTINTETKLMVLLSRENNQGTGPLQANLELFNSNKSFVIASKIINLCSIYDELLKKAIQNKEPLENISIALEMFSANGILDKDLTELFINHIPLYSVGVKVKLSNGKYAQVIKTFTERVNNYKPIVKIIPTDEIVDLRNETTITVQEVCGDEISFAELVARQIIDMNNEVTESEEYKKAI